MKTIPFKDGFSFLMVPHEMENVADGEKSQKTNPAEYDKYCFLIKRWSKTFNFVVLLAVMAISFLSYTHWAWMFVYAFSLSVLIAFGHVDS